MYTILCLYLLYYHIAVLPYCWNSFDVIQRQVRVANCVLPTLALCCPGEADKRLKAMQSQMSSQKQKLQQLQTELAEAKAGAGASHPDTDIDLLTKENAALKEKVGNSYQGLITGKGVF
jgi:uncharacterized coiled-coil protein SlyX